MTTAGIEKKKGPSIRPPDWSSMGASGHAVQFYPSDGHLLDLLSRFVGTALVAGDVAIVIATREHRDGLAARLKGRGFNLNIARRQGRYLALDAVATLEKISRDGRPDETLFREVVGGMMSKLNVRERPKIAAFGEMVALLWADGKPESAIHLEQMWNALAAEYDFCLCCAYPMRGFGTGHAASFMQICAQHSHVFTIAQTPPLASAR